MMFPHCKRRGFVPSDMWYLSLHVGFWTQLFTFVALMIVMRQPFGQSPMLPSASLCGFLCQCLPCCFLLPCFSSVCLNLVYLASLLVWTCLLYLLCLGWSQICHAGRHLGNAGEAAVHLLGRLLAFDPARRCSAEEALTHEYLHSFEAIDLQLG